LKAEEENFVAKAPGKDRTASKPQEREGENAKFFFVEKEIPAIRRGFRDTREKGGTV